MILSILIPVYNFDCRDLARSLSRQADSLVHEIEIIVADDGSTDRHLAKLNAEIAAMPHCRYIARKENVGRAAIRNFLAEESQGEWLMFMDCDGRVIYMNFLQKYLESRGGCDVVYGGIIHSREYLTERNSLRYDYEHRCERRFTARQRTENPDLPFRTFCFMIRRESYDRVRFDESFTDYGYEDVLFGQQLREQGMIIRHINNPLENTDLEPNDVFVAKTEEALRTLHAHETLFGNDVRLVRWVRKLASWHILPLVKVFSKLYLKPLRRNLSGNHPLTSLFDLYKLGYYCQL
jgi:glycosyltransferase involved in cell wall biosynthesis